MNVFKAPKINKNSNLGRIVANLEQVINIPFKIMDTVEIKKKLKVPYRSSTFLAIRENTEGLARYFVSGSVKVLSAFADEIKMHMVSYSFPVELKSGLTEELFQYGVYAKLQEYYSAPRDGASSNTVLGLSVDIIDIPNNYRLHGNVRMHQADPLRYKLFEKLSNFEDISLDDTNCVVEYLYNELRKYKAGTTKKSIIDGLNIHCGDVLKDGCSLVAFEKFMEKYRYVSYNVIGPNLDIISRKGSPNRTSLMLTFYINNSHLYCINDIAVQMHIAHVKQNSNVGNYFNKLHDFTFHEAYEQVDTYDNLEDGKTYICNKDDVLKDILIKTMKDTGSAVEWLDMDMTTGKITKFKHPTENYFICSNDDYSDRVAAFAKLREIMGFNGIGRFKNQSFATMSLMVLNSIADIRKSYYNKQAFYYLDTYEPKALVDSKGYEGPSCGVDFCKQYSTIFYKYMSDDRFYIPVYDIHSTVVKYDNSTITIGEYYIEECEYETVKFGGCFLHYGVVKEMLKLGMIQQRNIKYMITTTQFFKGDCFKTFVEMTSKLDKIAFKKMNNFLNGCLKNAKVKKGTCYFTNDVNCLIHIIFESEKANKQIKWNTEPETGFSFVKAYSESPNYHNTSSFHRTTKSISMLMTLSLVAKCAKVGSIIKVKTDCVYYKPYGEEKCKTSKCKGDILKTLGKVRDEQAPEIYYEQRYETKEFVEYKINKTNVLLTGTAGSGKSTKMILDSDINESILFLSGTNNAVFEMQKKCNTHNHRGANWKFSTFASFFLPCTNYKMKLDYANTYDKICVDEVFMTPIEFLRILKNSTAKKIYCGDDNQLHAFVQCKSKDVSFNLIKSEFFNDCERDHRDYIKEYARFTKSSFKKFERFRTGGVSDVLAKLPEMDADRIYDFYLCFTNATRYKLNRKVCESKYKKDFTFLIETKGVLVEEHYKIDVGMPLICNLNIPSTKDMSYKQIGIANNWKCTLISIHPTGVILNGIILEHGKWDYHNMFFEIKTFKRHFSPLHCSTISKFQGGEINGDYAIVDLHHMMCNRNSFYTCITRCHDYKNVHLDRKGMRKYYSYQKYTNPLIKMDVVQKLKYLIKIIFTCDCEAKMMCYQCNDEMKYKVPKKTYLDAKKHHKYDCANKLELLHKGIMTGYGGRLQLSVYDEMIEIERPKTVSLFREVKDSTMHNAVYIHNDYIRYNYYIDGSKHEKKIRTKKSGNKKGLIKMKKFIDTHEIKPTYTDQTDKQEFKEIDLNSPFTLSF